MVQSYHGLLPFPTSSAYYFTQPRLADTQQSTQPVLFSTLELRMGTTSSRPLLEGEEFSENTNTDQQDVDHATPISDLLGISPEEGLRRVWVQLSASARQSKPREEEAKAK